MPAGDTDSFSEKGGQPKHGGPKVVWKKYSDSSHHRARILGAFLTLLVAFILALLCVCSGNKPGYIESANLFTVNTSTLGHFDIKSSLPSIPLLNDKRDLFDSAESAAGSVETAVSNAIPTPVHSAAGSVASHAQSAESALSSKVQSAEGALSTAVDSATSAAQNALDNAADGLAKKLGIHQFYSVHVRTWCEGDYTPGYIANATNIPAKNVTKCSNAKRNQTFDLTDVVGRELVPGVSLSDLHWPDAIADGFRALKMAINAMFVLYCIGIAFLGLGLLGVFLALVRAQTRMYALCNMIFAWLGFFSLMLASAIATGVATKATNLVNEHGHEIGLSARRGNQFQGMTWSAAILTFIAAVLWTDVFRKHLEGRVIWHVGPDGLSKVARGRKTYVAHPAQKHERGDEMFKR